MTPAADIVNPGGSAPALVVHVYGVVPPVAARVVCGYAVPTVPGGNDVVVIVGLAANEIALPINTTNVAKKVDLAFTAGFQSVCCLSRRNLREQSEQPHPNR